MIRRRTVLWLAAAYALTGVYVVQPDEQAVVRRFGAAQPRLRGPGAQWGWPWPWDRVDRFQPLHVRRITLGGPDTASGVLAPGATQLLTGDRNLVNVRATVQYSVAEPIAYLFAADGLEDTVRVAAEAVLTEALESQAVDRALTLGKRELAAAAADRLQATADRYGLGITIRSVDLGSVEPPPEVAAAFEQVTSALRQREQALNEAQSYSVQVQAEAQGAAQRELDLAKAYRDRIRAQAQGEADRFYSLLAEYRRQKVLTSARLYLETLAEILPRLKSKLLLDDGAAIDLSIFREEPARAK